MMPTEHARRSCAALTARKSRKGACFLGFGLGSHARVLDLLPACGATAADPQRQREQLGRKGDEAEGLELRMRQPSLSSSLLRLPKL